MLVRYQSLQNWLFLAEIGIGMLKKKSRSCSRNQPLLSYPALVGLRFTKLWQVFKRRGKSHDGGRIHTSCCSSHHQPAPAAAGQQPAALCKLHSSCCAQDQQQPQSSTQGNAPMHCLSLPKPLLLSLSINVPQPRKAVLEHDGQRGTMQTAPTYMGRRNKSKEKNKAVLCPSSDKGSSRPWYPGFTPCPSQSTSKAAAPSLFVAQS